jgi:hypothetical protein
MFVSVNFQHKRLSSHVLCRTRHFGSGGMTRPAPLRPEVYENRHAGGIHDFVKKSCIYLERFIDRRQRSLTRTATARLREMIRSNTIFLATLFACSDCRHLLHPSNTD